MRDSQKELNFHCGSILYNCKTKAQAILFSLPPSPSALSVRSRMLHCLLHAFVYSFLVCKLYLSSRDSSVGLSVQHRFQIFGYSPFSHYGKGCGHRWAQGWEKWAFPILFQIRPLFWKWWQYGIYGGGCSSHAVGHRIIFRCRCVFSLWILSRPTNRKLPSIMNYEK